MTADRPVLGILFMVGFCILAPLGDAIAKLLGESIPLLQLLLVRFMAQMVLLWPLIWITRLPVKLPRRLFLLMVVRTLLHMIGIGAMFTSLRFLPLADAVAIAFVMPFIMLLLGRFVLDEEIGSHRISACAVGFVGTLLVIQPSFVDVGWPALLPLLVAVVFALFMLVTRKVAKEVDAMNLQAQSGVIATVMLAVLAFSFSSSDLEMLQIVQPSAQEWLLLGGIGTIGTMAHLLMTWSLRFAPSATLAPMQYLEIPVATMIGLLIFKDFPNGLTAFGILITVSAGLYIIYREQHLSRKAT